MSGGAELSYVLHSVRRGGWIIILTGLLGLLAPMLLSGDDLYEARVQLLVTPPIGGNADALSLERNVNTQIAALRGVGLSAAVAEELGSTTTGEVANAVFVEQVAGSDIVVVGAVAEDAGSAEELATTYIQVYLRERQARASGVVDAQLARLATRIDDVVARITSVNQELAAAVAPFIARQGQPGAPPIPDPVLLVPEAATQQQALTAEYSQLLELQQELQERRQLVSPGQILTEAVVNERPARPPLSWHLAIVLAAVLIGIAIAVALERLSPLITHEIEVQEELGQPVAARLVQSSTSGSDPAELLNAGRGPSEAERRVRTRVERLRPECGPTIASVTSATATIATSLLALSLARQLALPGRRVVLLNLLGADSPLCDAFDLSDDGVERVLQQGDLTALTQVAPGVLALSQSKETSLPRQWVNDLMAVLAVQGDVVVVDAGPLLTSPLAEEIVARSHAVVLSIPLDRLRKEQLREAGWRLGGRLDNLIPVTTQRPLKFLLPTAPLLARQKGS